MLDVIFTFFLGGIKFLATFQGEGGEGGASGGAKAAKEPPVEAARKSNRAGKGRNPRLEREDEEVEIPKKVKRGQFLCRLHF